MKPKHEDMFINISFWPVIIVRDMGKHEIQPTNEPMTRGYAKLMKKQDKLAARLELRKFFHSYPAFKWAIFTFLAVLSVGEALGITEVEFASIPSALFMGFLGDTDGMGASYMPYAKSFERRTRRFRHE